MVQQIVGSNPTCISSNVHIQTLMITCFIGLSAVLQFTFKIWFLFQSRSQDIDTERCCVSEVCPSLKLLQRLLLPVSGGWTATNLRGLTYPKILCNPEKEERKREKDSPSTTTEAESFRGRRTELTHRLRKRFRSDWGNRTPEIKTSSLPDGFVKRSSCETRMVLILLQPQLSSSHITACRVLYWSRWWARQQQTVSQQPLLPSALRVKCTVMFQPLKHRIHL